ncbi:hypothetical protein F5Y15DRAFT_412524 [Xylariaceae sp. FL0016]|nr:hypothetical protein F5Y15DRAFT_412524 [Xylariaceae sp. FL0016]
MASTVLFVPGSWEGPAVFDQVRQLLEAKSIPTAAAPLASTGKRSPDAPSLQEHMAAVRDVILSHVDAGREVVLVLHSGGGVADSNAMGDDLPIAKRKELGLPGGVRKIVAMAAGLFPPGFQHQHMPFEDMLFPVHWAGGFSRQKDNGGMWCKDAEEALFHDVPDKDKWMPLLQPQPAEGLVGVIKYAGWQNVPTTYVVADKDWVIVHVDAGHMLMLAKPQEMVDIIAKEALE